LIFNDFGKDLSLHVNSFYRQEKTTEIFKIKKIRDDRIKLVHEDIGKLNRRKYVDMVDEYRKSNGGKSIYDLENRDTILVTFTKGLYDELYLK